MFCTECGTKSGGGKFCGNCGAKLASSESSSPKESAWPDVEARLNEKWKNVIDVSTDEFASFSLSDWAKLQTFLKAKSGHFLGCATYSEFESKLALSEKVSQPILDTMETLDECIASYIETLEPSSSSKELMAAAGTRTQLPFMPASSGDSYYYPAVENAIRELDTLTKVLRIGKTDNFIGESFDGHLEAISLLSDFGRSFLVLYLGDTESELALLSSWAAKPGSIANEMAAVAVAGLSTELIGVTENGVLNPRMVSLLVDSDNYCAPWWMEMGFWASVAQEWKKRALVGLEDMDLDSLAMGMRNALDPMVNKNGTALHMFSQDQELFDSVLEILES
jgi:hypothetical protein